MWQPPAVLFSTMYCTIMQNSGRCLRYQTKKLSYHTAPILSTQMTHTHFQNFRFCSMMARYLRVEASLLCSGDWPPTAGTWSSHSSDFLLSSSPWPASCLGAHVLKWLACRGELAAACLQTQKQQHLLIL